MSDIFGNLNVANTDLPEVDRRRNKEPNPFEKHVGESYRDGVGKSIQIPAEHGSAACQKIRAAADKVNVGVRIVVTDKSGKKLDSKALIELREKKSKATITVMFQGQEKRAYSERKKKDETPATPETPAADKK